MKLFSVSAFLLLAVAAAPAPKTLTGNWGGDGFSLRVVGNQAIIQTECAYGQVAAPIGLDANGRFTAKGYFNPVTSGYRLSDLAPADKAADISGTVNGNTLALTIRVAGQSGAHHHTLARGTTLSFARCG